jgi:hypothetical protein
MCARLVLEERTLRCSNGKPGRGAGYSRRGPSGASVRPGPPVSPARLSPRTGPVRCRGACQHPSPPAFGSLGSPTARSWPPDWSTASSQPASPRKRDNNLRSPLTPLQSEPHFCSLTRAKITNGSNGLSGINLGALDSRSETQLARDKSWVWMKRSTGSERVVDRSKEDD